MVSRVIPVDPFDLVIFGATGDLATRKILPGLYRRMCAGQMPPEARIIGAARSDLTSEAFRAQVRAALEEHAQEHEPETAEAFLSCLSYVQVDATGDGGWAQLARRLDEEPGRIRAFYLSVAPQLFGVLAERLSQSGVVTPEARIVVEKPLGRDLETARALNEKLALCFDERQIYRIDHYLGKETVQNLMAVRFANALFEPLWNARHIDHVQITVSETLGVAGRGSYYDRSGAMRDMIQNHLMQLLCLTAMEAPAHYTADHVRDEKLKVIHSLEPVGPGHTVRGQYRANGASHDYRSDVENPTSKTESYVAMKVQVANWRWNGTPFYLRTGKRMRARVSEIAVVFKEPPHSIFPRHPSTATNSLVIRLQPDEGITLRMTIKEPGPGGMRLVDVPLDMTFADALGPEVEAMPDAYERLIMDVIRGDQTLFMRGDEVEAAWAWVDPVISGWQEEGTPPQLYDSGGSGPEDALALLHRDGRRWRTIEE